MPNVFEDGTPASATEVNENFDAPEAAIDAIPEGPAGPQGEKGPQGEPGPAGADGVSDGLTCSSTNQIIVWDGSAWVCTDMRWEPYSWKYVGSSGFTPSFSPFADGTFRSFAAGEVLQVSAKNLYGYTVLGPFRFLDTDLECFVSLVSMTGTKKIFEVQVANVSEIAANDTWLVEVSDLGGGSLDESLLTVDGIYRFEILGCP